MEYNNSVRCLAGCFSGDVYGPRADMDHLVLLHTTDGCCCVGRTDGKYTKRD